MINWLHRLFNPHCIECDRCNSCEILRSELVYAHRRETELLSYLFPTESISSEEEPKIIQPKVIPWKVKQQMLEDEDRQRAILLNKQKEIESLEKELGIEQNVT